MNILKLEKRGMDFAANDARVTGSDIGNYRVNTGGYTVRAKDGLDYFIEVTRADKYAVRRVSKRTGKPLKRAVRELEAANIAYFSAWFIDPEDNICKGSIPWFSEAWKHPRPYTTQGILDIVNRFAAVPYDGIEFV